MPERDLAAEMRRAADPGEWLPIASSVLRDWADQVDALRHGTAIRVERAMNAEYRPIAELLEYRQVSDSRVAEERARIRRELESVLEEMRFRGYGAPNPIKDWADRIEQVLRD